MVKHIEFDGPVPEPWGDPGETSKSPGRRTMAPVAPHSVEPIKYDKGYVRPVSKDEEGGEDDAETSKSPGRRTMAPVAPHDFEKFGAGGGDTGKVDGVPVIGGIDKYQQPRVREWLKEHDMSQEQIADKLLTADEVAVEGGDEAGGDAKSRMVFEKQKQVARALKELFDKIKIILANQEAVSEKFIDTIYSDQSLFEIIKVLEIYLPKREVKMIMGTAVECRKEGQSGFNKALKERNIDELMKIRLIIEMTSSDQGD